ncbi:hypothetical protein [Pelagicoccus sp. SDUM812005]|uniref:hypothetical protein n=1 Tax=Pelagicoccus sp. SDUM812005 TaxID=3041257 RepID=UPI00280E2DA5|nr:hypothetical protein [Pelagicoccus sp. SDUM812005]MDQ8179587.1 hypothetical protein [Pelagicoccus sp. SDUM812005]
MKKRKTILAAALMLSCGVAGAANANSPDCEDANPSHGKAGHWSWLEHLGSKNKNYDSLSSLFERLEERKSRIVSWDLWRDAGEQRATFQWGATGLAAASGPSPEVDRYYASRGGSRFSSFLRRKLGDSYLRQGSNEAFFVDFTVTATGERTELRSFEFSALFNNPAAQRYWTLSVESGDITIGTVARGEISTEGAWEAVEVDLSQLADKDLGPGGTATFRLSWWGGAASEVAAEGTGIDKVVVKAAVPVVPEGIRPGLGERADWLRGSWGINWKPAFRANGKVETLVVDDFLDQIEGLRTIDYIQLHLGESHISSPVHWGTHPLIESLWRGDVDEQGNPINLAVPRAEIGFDPFEEMLKAVKARGLKTQVYVNSAQMLGMGPNGDIPDVTARWKEWCDTDPAAQAFIKSKDYHVDGEHPNRPYVFCYAEFVLRDYAIRYGDLVDGWLFDAGYKLASDGDDSRNGVLEDQRLYEAFALACRAGNANAAVSFNNSPGARDGINNPFTPATRFDDYMFGHPFAGGKQIGNHDYVPAIGTSRYDMNYSIIQWMTKKGGNAHLDDGPWTWDDKVVAHFDPPMSTSAWNSGGVPALTDEEFVLWNREAMLAGGAISWGAPLRNRNGLGATDVLVQDWAMAQLTLMDEELQRVQFPDTVNWARASTSLPEAIVGQAYYHTLVEGVDFWDPQGNPITGLAVVDPSKVPDWLSLEKSTTDEGVWILSGIPTECHSTAYSFSLVADNGTVFATRDASLTVSEIPLDFEAGEPGVPVWASDRIVLDEAEVPGFVETFLIQGVDFYDFEGDALVVSKVSGPDWLNVEAFSEGIWSVSGVPTEENYGLNEWIVSVTDGVNSAEIALEVFVLPVLRDVDIFATPNTNYGTDSVATLVSDTLVAYDGLATFKLAFDVVPQAGTAIVSKATGGVSTATSWGVDADGIFNGNLGDEIDGVGNLRVIDFNPNGGVLSPADVLDLSFVSVSIVNGQSPGKDSVGIAVAGSSHGLGNLGGTPFDVELEDLAGGVPVEDFSLYVNAAGVRNKWSVYSVKVKFR